MAGYRGRAAAGQRRQCRVIETNLRVDAELLVKIPEQCRKLDLLHGVRVQPWQIPPALRLSPEPERVEKPRQANHALVGDYVRTNAALCDWLYKSLNALPSFSYPFDVTAEKPERQLRQTYYRLLHPLRDSWRDARRQASVGLFSQTCSGCGFLRFGISGTRRHRSSFLPEQCVMYIRVI